MPRWCPHPFGRQKARLHFHLVEYTMHIMAWTQCVTLPVFGTLDTIERFLLILVPHASRMLSVL